MTRREQVQPSIVHTQYLVANNGHKSHRVVFADRNSAQSLPPWSRLPSRTEFIYKDHEFKLQNTVWINIQEQGQNVDYLALIDEIRVLPDGNAVIKAFWFDTVENLQVQGIRGLPQVSEDQFILTSWADIHRLDTINDYATAHDLEGICTEVIALYSPIRTSQWVAKPSNDPKVSWVARHMNGAMEKSPFQGVGNDVPLTRMNSQSEESLPNEGPPAISDIEPEKSLRHESNDVRDEKFPSVATKSPKTPIRNGQMRPASVFDVLPQSPPKKRRLTTALVPNHLASPPKKSRIPDLSLDIRDHQNLIGLGKDTIASPPAPKVSHKEPSKRQGMANATVAPPRRLKQTLLTNTASKPSASISKIPLKQRPSNIPSAFDIEQMNPKDLTEENLRMLEKEYGYVPKLRHPSAPAESSSSGWNDVVEKMPQVNAYLVNRLLPNMSTQRKGCLQRLIDESPGLLLMDAESV